MNSFVISQFIYCPITWVHCQRNANNSTNRIQGKPLVTYNEYTSTCRGMSEKDYSVTIHQQNIPALALDNFKTKNNLNPSFIKDIF